MQFFNKCFKPDTAYFLLYDLFGKDPPAQRQRANMITVVIIHSEGMLHEQEYHK